MSRKNKFATINIHVGRMKPIGQGMYKRAEIINPHKPTEKVFVHPGEYYFHKRF